MISLHQCCNACSNYPVDWANIEIANLPFQKFLEKIVKIIYNNQKY